MNRAGYALAVIIAAAEARATQLEISSREYLQTQATRTAEEHAEAALAIRNALAIYRRETT